MPDTTDTETDYAALDDRALDLAIETEIRGRKRVNNGPDNGLWVQAPDMKYPVRVPYYSNDPYNSRRVLEWFRDPDDDEYEATVFVISGPYPNGDWRIERKWLHHDGGIPEIEPVVAQPLSRAICIAALRALDSEDAHA